MDLVAYRVSKMITYFVKLAPLQELVVEEKLAKKVEMIRNLRILRKKHVKMSIMEISLIRKWDNGAELRQ